MLLFRAFRLVSAAAALGLCGCENEVAPGHVHLTLAREETVSIGLFDSEGKLAAQPRSAVRLARGRHLTDCRLPGLAPGEYTWRALGTDPPRLEYAGSIGTGLWDFNRQEIVPAGGESGPPCAVAADELGVYLGWRHATTGHEIVACTAGGSVRWGHHIGPGPSGVWHLAASDGVVYVLGGTEGPERIGGAVYKLDARTGAPLRWGARPERALRISSLWPRDAKVKPVRAEWIAAAHGRIYLTFAEEHFIAVLDGATGAYVTTLTAPQPAQMTLSKTIMNDPQHPGREKIIDFGIAVIREHGLAYFLMEHDPVWVMVSDSRWLAPQERIAAITMRGDTMKSSDVTVYTALGPPFHQVQLRPADAVEGFVSAVGVAGGRTPEAPWNPAALLDIRSIAVDPAGKLWIAEGDRSFGRFTIWDTSGPTARIEREILGPFDSGALVPSQDDPVEAWLGGLRWRIDPATRTASIVERASPPAPASGLEAFVRDASGLVLWQPTPGDFPLRQKPSSTAWTIHRQPDGATWAWLRQNGAHLFSIRAVEKPRLLAEGKVSIRARTTGR
jgi:hypothetical protein